MNKYPYAHYTMTFLEFLDKNPDFLDEVINFDTSSEEMKKAVKNYWLLYEINGETELVFKARFKAVAEMQESAYKQKLAIYNAMKFTGDEISKIDNITYDLPAKNVAVENQYPSTREETIESGSLLSINAYDDFLKKVRVIAVEYAKEFNECFLKVFQ